MPIGRETLAEMEGQQSRSVADADEFVCAQCRRLQARLENLLSYGAPGFQ
jgi:hypothetical protein